MNAFIEIRNFGPIKSAKIEIKPITILIGEQAAGKSTIAKLIAIFNDPEFYHFSDDNISLDFNEALHKYNIHNYLNSTTDIIFKSIIFDIKYSNKSISNFHCNAELTDIILTLRLLNKPIRKTEQILENIRNSNLNTQLKEKFHKYIKDIHNSENLIKDTNNVAIKQGFRELAFEEISKNMQQSIYIPTERFLISILNNSALEFMNNSLTLPKSVTQFGTYFQKAKKELNSDISIKFLNINYINKDGFDSIKNKSKELQLQESASGYQSVVPLFLVMKYYAQQVGGKSIIIEEPELNLYPKTQNNLMNVLIKFTKQNNNNLIVTTHSPYILTSINNLLFAGQILNNDKSKENEISEIIPKESWIAPRDFVAYHIENGKSKLIFDKKTLLISETELDNASEIINANFDCLMDIYKTL